ncbi:MAG: NAD/NADP octopine/nopaline dehydrogenase family protein [Bacillota bacterium]|nr:NAD/NADP octopine/nopaline dehydrogenase family protein [Bacillota bacterium]MDW7678540.1 NAD/NADP octopine/nopaline dehydrogenase family protein [Bacillota bacterium]
MKVAILGAGGGGLAAAADWSLAGHEVRIFDFKEFSENIAAINAQGGITAEGDLNGFAPVRYAGHSIETAVSDVDVILAVGPAYSTAAFAHAVKEHIDPKQYYVVCPGSCGGALITKKIFSENVNAQHVCISETSTLPYAARLTSPNAVKVFLRLKGGLLLATIPGSRADQSLEIFRQVYSHAEKAANVLQTMLQNANPVIHPVVTLMNAALIERTGGQFLFYEEGVTPAVGNLIKAVDEERIAIGAKLGVTILPDPEMGCLQGYMTEANYKTGYAHAPGFKGIMAQSKLDYRYFNEDVGYGLVFMADLGKQAGVDTPMIDAVINLASAAMEKDYRALAARTLDKIGYSIEEILHETFDSD